MDGDRYERLRNESLRLDDRPAGILTAIVASRGE